MPITDEFEFEVAKHIIGVGVLIGTLIVGLLAVAGVALSLLEALFIATVSGLILAFVFFYYVG
ncbi:hypothetical protein [Halorussus halophilus]|uniref:hypothetical protein n=1 Tax=Halorussus halophilus TaxID=2650975 RepID=UPI001301141C|nr:hypothetical protein [Halorussus halophilus]